MGMKYVRCTACGRLVQGDRAWLGVYGEVLGRDCFFKQRLAEAKRAEAERKDHGL